MAGYKVATGLVFTLLFACIIFLELKKTDETLVRKRRALMTKPDGIFATPCGKEFRDSFGFIASPGFPNQKYPSMSNCDYHIEAPAGKIIKMDFLYMDMEEGPIQKNSDCSQDSVTILDSADSETLIGGQRFCGQDTPFRAVYSKTNSVTIKFKTDESEHFDGFVIKYTIVDQPGKSLSCDFEQQQGLCFGWGHIEMGNFPWKSRNGMTPSGPKTGPRFDHTFKNENGTYLYMEASGALQSQTAIVRTAAGFIPKNETYCFQFWYHMKGKGIGRLDVRQISRKTPKWYHAPTIWSMAEEQGNSWYPYYRNVSGSNFTAVAYVFVGNRGPSYDGDIAIDDIALQKRPCPYIPPPTTPASTTAEATTTPGTTPESTTTPKPTTVPTTIPTTTSKCKADEYECSEVGNCIESSWVCDNYRDCKNNDDEANCIKVERNCTAMWGNWEVWRSCSKTCGGGSKIHIRKCVGGISESCGCVGVTLIEEECNTHSCVIEWTAWSAWSECSSTCGGGFRTRKRNCTDPTPLACPGPSEENIGCNEEECPFWARWGPWSPCMKFCDGGMKTRGRTCSGGKISECIGGTDERESETWECDDVTMDNLGCSGPGHEWQPWGSCNATCGGGSKSRARKCRRYFSSDIVCDDYESVQETCNSEECQTECPVGFGVAKKPVLQSSCTNGNYAGSVCSFTCQGGFQIKGDITKTCQEGGSWTSEKLPTCRSICRARNPPLLAYQKRECPKSCILDKQCDNGTRCNCDGACGRTCSDPETTCNGNIFKYKLKGECTQGYGVGSYCKISCVPGYVLAGISRMSCESDGRWDQRFIPVCRPQTAETNCRLRRSRHDKCCGRKSYDSRQQFCCRGVVLYKSYVASGCCGGKPYHTRTGICCNGKVYNKRLFGCCGGNAYRSGWNPRCCGEALYDIYDNYCDASDQVQTLKETYQPTYSWEEEEEV